MKMLLIPHDASSIGACRPRIFFINGFLCFLEDEWQRNGERERERRRHFKEKMSLEEAHHHRRPWIRAWRKKEMNEGRGREEHEISCSKGALKSEDCISSPINLTSRIFSLICASISRVAFGGIYKEQDEFVVSLIRKIVESGGGFDLADVFPSIPFLYFLTGKMTRLKKLHKQVDKVLENIIREHQEKNKIAKEDGAELEDQDFIDLLLRIQQDDTLDIQMTTNNIKALILDIFAAGTDTSASTLEWAMAEMMRNPRVWEKAQAELRQAFREKEIIHESDLEQLTYLKLVIKETFRVHPPTPLLLPRECSQPTIIDGYEIPAKTKVMVNAYAICKDSQYWIDADRFVPERFEGSSIDFKGNNFNYLPFGGGRRICPGMTLGLASIMLPLALLLYHFNWELPNKMKPEEMNMDEHFGLAIGRKNELHLIPNVNL
ncbi:hypothetical protein AAZX31_10G109200 [Glycine max]